MHNLRDTAPKWFFPRRVGTNKYGPQTCSQAQVFPYNNVYKARSGKCYGRLYSGQIIRISRETYEEERTA